MAKKQRTTILLVLVAGVAYEVPPSLFAYVTAADRKLIYIGRWLSVTIANVLYI